MFTHIIIIAPGAKLQVLGMPSSRDVQGESQAYVALQELTTS